jgi:peptidoglycan hydrolase CwlO-like protein
MLSPQDHQLLQRIEAGQLALKAQITALQTSVGKLLTMSENIDTELATETTQEQALAAAVQANSALLASLQATATALQAALAAAQTAGATPDQLAAFDAVHEKVSADIAALAPAPAPEAPAGS